MTKPVSTVGIQHQIGRIELNVVFEGGERRTLSLPKNDPAELLVAALDEAKKCERFDFISSTIATLIREGY